MSGPLTGQQFLGFARHLGIDTARTCGEKNLLGAAIPRVWRTLDPARLLEFGQAGINSRRGAKTGPFTTSETFSVRCSASASPMKLRIARAEISSSSRPDVASMLRTTRFILKISWFLSTVLCSLPSASEGELSFSCFAKTVAS